MIDLCKDCEKKGKCYFEAKNLVCKKLWEYQKNQDKKEREIFKATANYLYNY